MNTIRPPLPAGTPVVLRRFNGLLQPPPGCDASNDYWRLIGQSGRIQEYNAALGRQLVLFDVPVCDLGLHCHNPLPNSLYLLDADLEALPLKTPDGKP